MCFSISYVFFSASSASKIIRRKCKNNFEYLLTTTVVINVLAEMFENYLIRVC